MFGIDRNSLRYGFNVRYVTTLARTSTGTRSSGRFLAWHRRNPAIAGSTATELSVGLPVLIVAGEGRRKRSTGGVWTAVVIPWGYRQKGRSLVPVPGRGLVGRERVRPLKLARFHGLARTCLAATSDAVGRFDVPLGTVGLERSAVVLDDTLDLAPGRFVLALVQLSDRIQDGIAIQRFAPPSVLIVDTWSFIALDRIVFRCCKTN